MQDADRIDQVEAPLGERQVEQVGLDDGDVGQIVAERGGLFHGGTEVHAEHSSAMAADEARVSTSAAAGIEHQLAGQFVGRHAGLDAESRLIFVRSHHIVTVPLAAEAGCIGVARQAGDFFDDREAGPAGATAKCLRRTSIEL